MEGKIPRTESISHLPGSHTIYTIVEIKQGQGSKKGWGRLKSGIGWISLDYVSII